MKRRCNIIFYTGGKKCTRAKNHKGPHYTEDAPDSECFTLPDGSCVAKKCKLHDPLETYFIH